MTLLAHPLAGEARVILVALVPPGFINLCSFELLVTLISNFMTKRRTSSIQPMPPKGEVVAGRKEFQKILVNY